MPVNTVGDAFELGVVFVHGIGSQRQGDTLVTWGDAIQQWLSDWASRTPPKSWGWIADNLVGDDDGDREEQSKVAVSR